MLISLHVKNLALIKETEVNFNEGLNILSGETGAGKSIIIGSINLALGARADKDMIRNGAEYALVELIFQITDEEIIKKIKELDIPIEDDGLVIIQRKIQPNRSICRICGETATTKQLKELSESLIDIHGQHEHQSLLYKKNHLEILDSFAGAKLDKIKDELKNHYHEYTSLLKELDGLSMDDGLIAKELSLAEYECEEIEEARLVLGEDEDLEALFRKMANSRQIAESVSKAFNFTGEGNENAADNIGYAVRELRNVERYDDEVTKLADELSNIDNLIADFNRNLSEYISDLEFDDETFAQTEERLNLVNKLKSKYGGTIENVEEYHHKLVEKIDRLKNADAYRVSILEKIKNKKKKLEELSAQASDIRTKEAEKLSKDMIAALTDLNFLDVKFEIQVRTKEEFSASGNNDVEFMISTNPGEPIRSLGAVASGGELSRIMLAIKTVLASRDKIPTMIFDEIDTGISGKTAWRVSNKLGTLAKSHQIICITHLPQIAAMADHHFKIAKEAMDNTTQTNIIELGNEEIINELARMLGSDEITQTVRDNAKELIETARTSKNKF